MNYTVVSTRICPRNSIKLLFNGYAPRIREQNNNSGINILTLRPRVLYIILMNKKHENLIKAGLFNHNSQKIKDPRFYQESSFFDPYDNLQVRYEMIRSHIIEGDNVSNVCKRFGVTRQTFYTIKEKLSNEGTAGLLQKKPGPRGPSKLNKAVIRFMQDRIIVDEKITAVQLAGELSQKFNITLHRRTIEKIMNNISKKKLYNSRRDTK